MESHGPFHLGCCLRARPLRASKITLIALLGACAPSHRTPSEFPVVGNDLWVGNYRCQQGRTALILDLHPASSTSVEGTFIFAHPTGVGSYRLAGEFDRASGVASLEATGWIERPGPTWEMVGISGEFSGGDTIFSGDIELSGCGNFEVVRTRPEQVRAAFLQQAQAIGLGYPRYVSAVERGGFSFEGLFKALTSAMKAIASCGVLHLGEEACVGFFREHLGKDVSSASCNAIVQQLTADELSELEVAVSALADAASDSSDKALKSVGDATKVALFAKCVVDTR